MLQSEFTTLTGYFPTAEEWDKIDSQYMASNLNKQDFCKTWKIINKISIKKQIKKKLDEERAGHLCDVLVHYLYRTINKRSKAYIADENEVQYFSSIENIENIRKNILKCTRREFRQTIQTCKRFRTIPCKILYRIAVIFQYYG